MIVVLLETKEGIWIATHIEAKSRVPGCSVAWIVHAHACMSGKAYNAICHSLKQKSGQEGMDGAKRLRAGNVHFVSKS